MIIGWIIGGLWLLIAAHHVPCAIADRNSPPGCCGTRYCDKDENGVFCDKGTLKKWKDCYRTEPKP